MTKRKIEKIKKIIRALNRVVVKIQVAFLLTLIYFLIITPVGFLQKLFVKADRLQSNTYWKKVETPKLTLEDFYKQF